MEALKFFFLLKGLLSNFHESQRHLVPSEMGQKSFKILHITIHLKARVNYHAFYNVTAGAATLEEPCLPSVSLVREPSAFCATRGRPSSARPKRTRTPSQRGHLLLPAPQSRERVLLVLFKAHMRSFSNGRRSPEDGGRAERGRARARTPRKEEEEGKRGAGHTVQSLQCLPLPRIGPLWHLRE